MYNIKRNLILGIWIILSFINSYENDTVNKIKEGCLLKEKDSTLQSGSIMLKNKYLSVKISKRGAELRSIYSDTVEYLWQADPRVWPKHSPLLFPIIGALNDMEYIYEGNRYTMDKHGFASDVEFDVVQQTNRSITLEYSETSKTKTNYPFDFNLQVHYRLHKRKLMVRYRVKNTMVNSPLLFSIGAHPAFNVPFENTQERNDYALVFDRDISPKTKLKKEGRYIDKYRNVFKHPGILHLSDSLFFDGALAFEQNPFTKVSFVHVPTNRTYLSVSFKKFPYLGIWSVNDSANFVCIEPWHGIGDSAAHNGILKQKEGIISLKPGKTFNCEFTVEVY